MVIHFKKNPKNPSQQTKKPQTCLEMDSEKKNRDYEKISNPEFKVL